MGVKVYDAWACGEIGSLGVTCSGCDNMIINQDHCYIEMVYPADSNISNGVLITGLHNKKMPLIRYNLGDQVIKAKRNACCGEFDVIGGVVGRPADVFEYGDIVIHNYCFRSTLLKFYKITDYQFVQVDNGVHFTLTPQCMLSPTEERECRQSLESVLEDLGLVSPSVTIEYVQDFIKTVAGKVPRFIARRNNQ